MDAGPLDDLERRLFTALANGLRADDAAWHNTQRLLLHGHCQRTTDQKGTDQNGTSSSPSAMPPVPDPGDR